MEYMLTFWLNHVIFGKLGETFILIPPNFQNDEEI